MTNDITLYCREHPDIYTCVGVQCQWVCPLAGTPWIDHRKCYNFLNTKHHTRAHEKRRPLGAIVLYSLAVIFVQLLSALQYRYRVYSVFDTEPNFSPCYLGCLNAIYKSKLIVYTRAKCQDESIKFNYSMISQCDATLKMY